MQMMPRAENLRMRGGDVRRERDGRVCVLTVLLCMLCYVGIGLWEDVEPACWGSRTSQAVVFRLYYVIDCFATFLLSIQ